MRTSLYLVALSAALLAGANVYATQLQDSQPVADQAPLSQAADASHDLRAIVLEAVGKAQWRADESAAWQDAKVDDTLTRGAQVRTGLRSSLTLRIGKNATVRVDRSTRVTLAQIVENQSTLTTRTAMDYGRAEFKVDHVGLTNDFAVVTPTTTLAVKGTHGAIESGAWGLRVTGAPTNDLNAIEIRYILNQVKAYLSQQGVSSDKNPGQVDNALASSVGIPAQWTALLNSDLLAKLKDAGFVTEASAKNLREIDIEDQGNKWVNNYVNDLADSLRQDPEFPEFSRLEIICFFLQTVVDRFRFNLETDGGDLKPFRITRLNQMRNEIRQICDDHQEFNDQTYDQIIDRVRSFCFDITGGEGVDGCVDFFTNAVDDIRRQQNLNHAQQDHHHDH